MPPATTHASGTASLSDRAAGTTRLAELRDLRVVAQGHMRAGRNDFALDTYRRILEILPDDAEALCARGMLLMHDGRFAAAIESFQRALEILGTTNGRETDIFVAGCHLSRCHLLSGALDRAYDVLEQTRRALPDTAERRREFSEQHCAIAVEFSVKQDCGRAVQHYRRALALWPDNTRARVNLTNLLRDTGERAELAEYVRDVTEAELAPCLFIACMPKSGSSFLKGALRALTGFTDANYSFAYRQNEQELYLPYIRQFATVPTVVQQHTRATEANIHLMQGFNIRPVVLVRDLADIAVSLADFYDSGAVVNTFFQPFWSGLSRDERLDVVVDQVMPWYLGFYASWVRAERDRRLEIMWLRYTEMVGDKPAAIAAVAPHFGIEKTADEIAAAIAAAEGDRAGTRFNQGVAGRGRNQLSDAQHGRIARLCAQYRDVDFAPVGF